jgi:hypothetical protein
MQERGADSGSGGFGAGGAAEEDVVRNCSDNIAQNGRAIVKVITSTFGVEPPTPLPAG